MTDKVQKIKEWISNEQDGLMDAQGNFEYPEHEGAYHILCNLDAYIDSLQEEPCNSCQGFNDKDKCDELVFTHNCPIVKNPVSIWHDASEKPREGSWVCVNRNGGLTISTFLYDDGKLHNDYIDNELENCKWAYPRDLINVDNICNFGKNLQEEPVSDDLKTLTYNYLRSYSKPEANVEYLTFASCIANWQKEKDNQYFAKKTIETLDEVFEDGRDNMKEQMMKNAIDAHCFGFQGDALFSFKLPADKYLVGSEVKVIVINED